MRSYASSAICLSRAKIPARIHSSRRARIVVAEQAESAIASYEQPNRRTCSSFSKTARSAILRRWQPSGRGVVDRAVRRQRGELVPQRFQQP